MFSHEASWRTANNDTAARYISLSRASSTKLAKIHIVLILKLRRLYEVYRQCIFTDPTCCVVEQVLFHS
jgi:hypothetical protein